MIFFIVLDSRTFADFARVVPSFLDAAHIDGRQLSRVDDARETLRLNRVLTKLEGAAAV